MTSGVSNEEAPSQHYTANLYLSFLGNSADLPSSSDAQSREQHATCNSARPVESSTLSLQGGSAAAHRELPPRR